MSATLNIFPSLNPFNARSWTLALIILLHFGFFLVLSSGRSVSIIHRDTEPTRLVDVKDAERPVEMKDGVAVPMWKQIPITFQLNERQRI